ncbi:MAG: DUF3488 and transglutaminase-like domain-containing protein [Planctomycetia bacterium]|nr:DUF3488 and transglutaminase-like domain-containing protein [Planctomycetia bacterium]
MFTERLLQVAITVTVSLGACLLGMGERESFYPLMIITGAFGSLLLTDFSGKFYLNQRYSNLLTCLAVVWILFDFLGAPAGSDRLVAISHLLVFLELIILFRRKTLYNYWILILMSFQQVAVSAAYPQSMSFGLMLLCYFFSTMVTIYLLAVFRRQQEMLRYEYPQWSLASAKRPPCKGWVSDFQDSVFFLPRRWFWSVFLFASGSFILGTIFFFFLPRSSAASFRSPPQEMVSRVGFSETIRLGELGEMIQDHQEILRVKLYATDGKTRGRPYKVHETPSQLYLRGAILNYYQNGSWSYSQYRGEGNPSLGDRQVKSRRPDWSWIYPPPRDVLPETLTWLDFVGDDALGRDIFTVWPFYGVAEETNQQIRFDPAYQRLLRRRPSRGELEYVLLTQAISRHEQAELVPCMNRVRVRQFLQLPPEEEIRNVQEKAKLWLDELLEVNENPTPYQVAKIFHRKFVFSQEFQYSLKPQPRDAKLDPIDDFVKNHPTGHCEYFSSALALMLRSIGIPTRVVVGFATDEFMKPGDFFVVRHSHAHSWTEVWITPEMIPEHVKENSPWKAADWKYGGWLRLDPTPAATEGNQGVSAMVDRVGSFVDWMESLWNTYVVRFNRPRQEETIYDPLQSAVQDSWFSLSTQSTLAKWQAYFLGNAPESPDLAQIRQKVFRQALFTFLILFTLGVLIYLRRRMTGHCGRSGRSDRKSRNLREHSVAFYQQLEKTLAAQGFRRADSQTAREFISEVEKKLCTDEYHPLVERYYQIRFGHRRMIHD